MKSLKQQHRELFIEAGNARQHYGIHHVLTNDVDVPHFVKAMERYESFFRVTITAQLYAVVIRLGKLFDKKNVSIPSLLKRLKKSHDANHTILKDIDKKMKNLEPRIEKIFGVRHKALAHLSAHSSSKEIFDEAGMTDDDLDVLTRQSLEILGDIGAFLDGPTVGEFSPTEDTTRGMLGELTRFLRILE